MLKILKYQFFAIFLLLFVVSGVISTNEPIFSTKTLPDEQEKLELFQPLIKKSIEKGVDYEFLRQVILDSSTQFNEKYVQINVSLSKDTTEKTEPSPSSQIYDKLVTEEAVSKITDFIQNNLSVLTQAEQRFNVNKDVLASLLWVETRLGDYLGYHHILSVFASLSLVDQPEFIEYNLKRVRDKYHPSKKEYVQLKQLLVERSKAKAKWAANEFIALIKLKDKLPYKITEIYGSYAGAFGLSQFLPSSFSKWAIDADGDGKFNLFSVKDAIFSTANYLSQHGFNNNNIEFQRKAIFAYNHSTKYVNTILLLANKVLENSHLDSTNTGNTK